jgi:large subunit ribosomal protein L6
MSKVGKVPVAIPAGVTVKVEAGTVIVEGKHGRLSQTYRPDMVDITVVPGEATVTRRKEGKEYRAYHGLYRSLLANMVRGVSARWEKALVIKGLGYRGRLQGSTLILDLGYAGPKEYPLPTGIEAELPNPSEIILRGADKREVGQVAAKIRALRKPNVYDGKGIRYKDEIVIQKAGKLGGPGGAS